MVEQVWQCALNDVDTTTEHSGLSAFTLKIKVDASKSKPNTEKKKVGGVFFINARILLKIFHTLYAVPSGTPGRPTEMERMCFLLDSALFIMWLGK